MFSNFFVYATDPTIPTPAGTLMISEVPLAAFVHNSFLTSSNMNTLARSHSKFAQVSSIIYSILVSRTKVEEIF